MVGLLEGLRILLPGATIVTCSLNEDVFSHDAGGAVLHEPSPPRGRESWNVLTGLDLDLVVDAQQDASDGRPGAGIHDLPLHLTRSVSLKDGSMRTRSLSLVFGVLLSAASQGQTILHQFDGNWTGGQFGYSVGGGSDVDGDGYDDLIVGSNSPIRRETAVFSGRTGAPLHTLADRGKSCSRAGDVDGDGFGDILVGRDPLSTVYSGRTGRALHSFGGSHYYQLGEVEWLGDVDGDGHDDVLIGEIAAQGAAGLQGHVYVHSGRTGALLYTRSGSMDESFGGSVAGVGDIDGDGASDFLVGASRANVNGSSSGMVILYSGRTATPIRTHYGGAPMEALGIDVAAAGDVDRDGTPDYVIGAPGATPNGTLSGSAYVFSGRTGGLLHRFDGPTSYSHFGSVVSGAGDLDGDGHDDLIVSAPVHRDSRGAVYAYSGRTGSVFFFMEGPRMMEYFGSSLAAAGDVNADGFADVIVGAYGADNNYSNTGSAYVVTLGRNGTPPWTREYGSSCAGSTGRLQRIDWSERAFVGRTLSVRLRNALPFTTAILYFGAPTDLDLTSIGMPGCRLLSTIDATLPSTRTDGMGHVSVGPLAVPNDPSLLGARLSAQWACMDPMANALGLTLSTAAAFTIGN